jgi:hypothetical protein
MYIASREGEKVILHEKRKREENTIQIQGIMTCSPTLRPKKGETTAWFK